MVSFRACLAWCALSLPSRGAWIEIGVLVTCSPAAGSLPSRGAWIEIFRFCQWHKITSESLPSRGAWIEIWQS